MARGFSFGARRRVAVELVRVMADLAVARA
jgi:hypothetical protein